MQPRKGASFGEAVDIILGYRFHHFTALTCTGDKQGEDLLSVIKSEYAVVTLCD
jgi:hypothetical protein